MKVTTGLNACVINAAAHANDVTYRDFWTLIIWERSEKYGTLLPASGSDGASFLASVFPISM